jgi:hypothetical protein
VNADLLFTILMLAYTPVAAALGLLLLKLFAGPARL